jgi:hypothetical protein
MGAEGDQWMDVSLCVVVMRAPACIRRLCGGLRDEKGTKDKTQRH